MPQAERERGFALAVVDRPDRGAIDLGHVGAVEERERDDPGGERAQADPEDGCDPEVDEEDVDVERERTEELGVGVGQDAEGPQRREAAERDDESQAEREHERDRGELERQLQAVCQRSGGVQDDVPAEGVGDCHGSFSARSSTETPAEKTATRTTRITATAVKASKGVK